VSALAAWIGLGLVMWMRRNSKRAEQTQTGASA